MLAAVGRLGGLMLAGFALLTATAGPVVAADELVLYGAGSLREAMTQIGREFQQRGGPPVRMEFGPSGMMRERIEAREKVDLFASADMEHPLRLERQNYAVAVAMFARNTLCAFSTSRVGLTTAGLLDLLLDPAVKLGTSAPNSDPLGGYTWQMFRKAEAVKAGSEAVLTGKARVLIGSGMRVPDGQDPVAAALNERTVDVFLAYCSARARLDRQVAGLTVTALPESLRVGPEYGIALMKNARPYAAGLMLYLLSTGGQATLERFGFTPVGLPAP
jgi:ABC-type molybdate transport system substrate-binding protein